MLWNLGGIQGLNDMMAVVIIMRFGISDCYSAYFCGSVREGYSFSPPILVCPSNKREKRQKCNSAQGIEWLMVLAFIVVSVNRMKLEP